jgi:hypothetical protein
VELDILLVLLGQWCFVLFFSIRFFRQEGIWKRYWRVIGNSLRGFLLSSFTIEARYVSIRWILHNTRPSMVFASILWFCHLKPQPRRTSVRNAWLARARDLLHWQPRVRVTLCLQDRDQWCPVVYGDGVCSTRAVSGDDNCSSMPNLCFCVLVWFLQVCLLDFQILLDFLWLVS